MQGTALSPPFILHSAHSFSSLFFGSPHSLFLITQCLSDTSDASNVYFPLLSRLWFSFFLTPCGFGMMWCCRAISVRGLTSKGFFIIPADRGITVSLSVSDAHTHFRDQQVISQPVGSPGVIPEQFTDKSDTVGQKAPSYLASVSACSTYSTQGGDENQHCGLCSAAESSSIKLTWIFTHSPSGTCWSWAGLSSN